MTIQELDKLMEEAAPFVNYEIVEKEDWWGCGITITQGSKKIGIGQLFSTKEDAKKAWVLVTAIFRKWHSEEYDKQLEYSNKLMEKMK